MHDNNNDFSQRSCLSQTLPQTDVTIGNRMRLPENACAQNKISGQRFSLLRVCEREREREKPAFNIRASQPVKPKKNECQGVAPKERGGKRGPTLRVSLLLCVANQLIFIRLLSCIIQLYVQLCWFYIPKKKLYFMRLQVNNFKVLPNHMKERKIIWDQRKRADAKTTPC